MAQLTVGTNSWVTVAEADAYMSLRVGAKAHWTDEVNKAACLVTGYKQIKRNPRFSLPDPADDNVKDAQMEQALFLAVHAADIISRKGLQAQGVNAAGIVKATYDMAFAKEMPFAPEVLTLLEDYARAGDGIYIASLERDEEEDAGETI